METFPVTHLTQHPGLVTYMYRMLALWYLTPVASCEVWVTAQCSGEEETERCYLPVFPGAGGGGGQTRKTDSKDPRLCLRHFPFSPPMVWDLASFKAVTGQGWVRTEVVQDSVSQRYSPRRYLPRPGSKSQVVPPLKSAQSRPALSPVPASDEPGAPECRCTLVWATGSFRVT